MYARSFKQVADQVMQSAHVVTPQAVNENALIRATVMVVGINLLITALPLVLVRAHH
jgi:hypothetical protein